MFKSEKNEKYNKGIDKNSRFFFYFLNFNNFDLKY